MSTTGNHHLADLSRLPIRAARPVSVIRGLALASIVGTAAVSMSVDTAVARGFGGFGGFHAGTGMNRSANIGMNRTAVGQGAVFRTQSRASRIITQPGRPKGIGALRPGSRIAQPPKYPGSRVAQPPKYPGGDGEPGRHHPPRRPPVIVGFPGGPVGPVGPAGPVGIGSLPPSGAGGAGGPPPSPGGGAGGPPSGGPTANDRRYVPDEVLISFTGNVQQQSIVTLAQTQRLALLGIHRLPLINTMLYRFRITDRRQVPAVIGSLQGDGRIAAAQPNYLYALQQETATSASRGDPFQYVLNKLLVPEAHGLATGGQVPVAVIDSAIDVGHPELRGIIGAGFDTESGPVAPHSHGTAMASAIAAHGRLLGLAPAARILPVRAFDASAVGAQGTSIRILDGLQWAVNSGARVVNMSFTGPADRKMYEMIAAARQKGLVLVAAAGNEGPQAPAAYPAAYPEVIAVTATDADDKILNVANRGSYVAVSAPGVEIFVAAPNGGYDFTTGTSVAAAHVSGLAALLIERNPGLTPDAVRAILVRTAKDLGAPGRDDEYGAGLVNAYEAVLTQAQVTAERVPAH